MSCSAVSDGSLSFVLNLRVVFQNVLLPFRAFVGGKTVSFYTLTSGRKPLRCSEPELFSCFPPR